MWTSFSILVIFAAVVMGIGKLLMPYSDRYQPRLEAWLSDEFGQPVVIDSFDGEWLAFGPRLTLRGMKLLPRGLPQAGLDGPGPAEVVIESAALDIKPLNALIPGLPLYNFRVIGANFELLRKADGGLRISGFGVRSAGDANKGSALRDLARVGEVVLEDSGLEYVDEALGIRLTLRQINGTLRMDDEEMSSEIQASLFDDRSGLVIGELEATLLLSLGPGQEVSGVRWQATTRELMLAALQGRLPANPFLPATGSFNTEAWGSWEPDDGHRVRGMTDLRKARLVNDYQDLWLEHVNTRFDWHFKSPKNWDMHFADFLFDDGQQSWTAPRLSLARHTADGLGLWISADWLPLGVPLRLARDVMSMYGTPWPETLPQAADGEVSELDLALDAAWRIELVRGDVRRASVSDWGRWPDLEGLDGRIALDRNSGRLDLQADQLLVDWPRMFREPIWLIVPGCVVDLQWGRAWQAEIRQCSVENPDLAAHGELVLRGNQGRPAVDANILLSRGSLGQLDPYWPESALKDGVKAWLRKGLLAGQLEAGRVSIRGDMDDWPFREGTGRFEAVAQIADGRLHYFDGWPEAREFSATARFTGASMDARGRVGALAGQPVEEVRASVTDFAAPVLTVDYSTAGDLPGLLGFVRNSPLRAHIGTDLSLFDWYGSTNIRGRIRMPMGRVGGELTLQGSVDLERGGFADPGLGVALEAVQGRLLYDESGFRGSGLRARFRDRPARLDLVADAGASEKFRAELSGVFGIQDVMPRFLVEDFSALSQAGGESEWRIWVSVQPGESDSLVNQAVLGIESALEGVTLDLPAPLAKAAGQAWPLRLRHPLGGNPRVLEVQIEDRFALRLDLSEGGGAVRRAVIDLDGDLPELPPVGLVRIQGSGGILDLDHWVDVIIAEAMRGQSLGELSLEPSRIHARELLFLDRRFAEVDLGLSVDGADIRGEFAADDINGKVRFTTGAGGAQSLSAEFERLALGEPLSTGVEMDIDPATLPALHLYARSLRYAGAELGETRIEAFPIANGFRFEKIDASSERLKLKANGEWLRDAAGQRSDFDISFASESLGDFLDSLDFASPVQGGQTLVTLNAWWPGPPAAFALSRLNGQVEFSVVGGNISNASAGGGRLLGLLSVQALPKRLALDFRDVFDSGFSFDEAHGTFNMENGIATTDDVLLRSTAANISISGRTDLVAQEYDQLLTIRPGVGNTLPIIGALAAGPGGAAAGLALQGLFHKGLAEATQVQYAVTGNWEDPQFEAVDVVPRQDSPPGAEEAGNNRGKEGR